MLSADTTATMELPTVLTGLFADTFPAERRAPTSRLLEYSRQESNLHPEREPSLNRLRLPIPPRELGAPILRRGWDALHRGAPPITSQGRDSNPQLRGMNPARCHSSTLQHKTC